MRCVKLTLPPRPRRRWLLMTTRLSMSSLAGTARTLVAVGTVRLASMLATVRAAAPFSGRLDAPSEAGAGVGVGGGMTVVGAGSVEAGAAWEAAGGGGP